ncbi:type II toxin-antitoxin system PemK/MazF family toxin [Arthrobacter sp. C152]
MPMNLRSLGNAVRAGLRLLRKPAPGHRPAARSAGPAPDAFPYPGDFRGRAAISYAPKPDGDPDPGEVVWTWVPYEEDHSQGKDRPVLIVGHNGPHLLALMLTSRDRVPAGSASRDYIDLGAGGWDRQDRPSEARLDRILQIRPDSIRREGAVLDRARFEAVAAGLRRRHGWTGSKNGGTGR